MIRWTLGAFSLLLIAPVLALTAPLEDYESRLRTALTSLQSAALPEREGALARMINLVPAEEEITWGNQKLKVNNAWLHELVGAFDEEADASKRQMIYQAMQTRLTALLEHVHRVRQQPGQDYQRERQRLAEILSQKEFQRHSTESWMGRLRRRVEEILARLARLFPNWQRDGDPVSRVLKILVWALAILVLYFFVRSIFSGFRREKRMKASGPQIILGTRMEPHTSPEALRQEALNLAQRREYRGAIRYLYISMLYELQQRGMLQLNAHSTNGEYLQRLRSAVAIYPMILYLTRRFDQCWYGKASPSEPEYQEFFDHYQTALSALSSQ